MFHYVTVTDISKLWWWNVLLNTSRSSKRNNHR